MLKFQLFSLFRHRRLWKAVQGLTTALGSQLPLFNNALHTDTKHDPYEAHNVDTSYYAFTTYCLLSLPYLAYYYEYKSPSNYPWVSARARSFTDRDLNMTTTAALATEPFAEKTCPGCKTLILNDGSTVVAFGCAPAVLSYSLKC